MRAGLCCLLATALVTGCATAGTRPPVTAAPAPAGVVEQNAPQTNSALPAYIRAVREASRSVRPRGTGALAAETWSRDLASAISRHTAAPTLASEVDLAQAYVRIGILDKAYEHFGNVSRLNPREAAAWDGLARIWRDWGFPQFGLGHAYRAVAAAPGSPAVHNTLGTILQSLGNGSEARARFARAVELDAEAAYAQNNLCYSWLMEGEAEAASVECRKALALAPGLVAASNNLALATAMAGDVAGAAEIFETVGGEAAAQYNVGIVHMAQQHYLAAADAFDRAAALQSPPVLASARARQARQHATESLQSEVSHERR